MQIFNFKLMALCNPPQYNKMTFIETLDKFLENEKSPNTPTNVGGDFKIDIGNKNLMVDTYLNSVAVNGFEFFCDKTTKVTETSSRSLDHYLFQNIKGERQVLLHQNFSDHYPAEFKFKFYKTTTNNEKVYRDTKFLSCAEWAKKNFNDLNQHLKNSKQSIFSQSNVNEAFDIFNRLLLEVRDVYAPMTISKTKRKCPQWFCFKLKT